MKEWKVEHAAWLAQKRKVEADGKLDLCGRRDRLAELGEEPPKPLLPVLTLQDFTVEGLAKTWPGLHAMLGIFTAEGALVSSGHAMNEDNKRKTGGALNELWDGKAVRRLRALDGLTMLNGRRLSLHLLIQPEAAADFLSDRQLRDLGLLSRALVAAPESIAGTRFYRDPDPLAQADVRRFGARVLALLEAPLPMADGTRNELAPPALPLSSDSKALWVAFLDHVERGTGSADDLAPIGDFAAKAAEHAARIAGVLALVADPKADVIGRDAMASGIALANWYVGETLRLHHAGRRDPKLVLADALRVWFGQRQGAVVLFRDVMRLGPSATRTKAAAEEAIGILKAHGLVVEVSARPLAYRLASGAGL